MTESSGVLSTATQTVLRRTSVRREFPQAGSDKKGIEAILGYYRIPEDPSDLTLGDI